jgi:epoxide hydrolase-like predicted phosphatase
MLQGIIFDVGNVISQTHGYRLIQILAHTYQTSQDQVRQAIIKPMNAFRIGKITETQFWQLLSEKLAKPLPSNAYDILHTQFDKALEIHTHVLDYIRLFKKQGIRVAAVSNTIPPFVAITKQRGGYADFDFVLNSCEVGLCKPDPAIYLLALKKLQTEPTTVLFIDDREENLKTSRQLGMQSFLVTNKDTLIQELDRQLEIIAAKK